MVRDLRPNASTKWRKGTISKVLGPLNYEVTIDGYKRQAHIDHILPCPSVDNDPFNDAASIPPTDAPSHQDDYVPMPIVDCEPCEASTDEAELVILRPRRNCRPPKRLIEEMN